jgi:hypothetical protein
MTGALHVFMAGLVLALSPAAFACEPAHVNFDGTAFATQPLQIENDKIYFYRGTPQELSIYYRSSAKKWCYVEAGANDSRPKTGCLSRKLSEGKRRLLINGKQVKNFVLKDAKSKPVATVNVIGKIMTANFIGGDGKPLGKRMVFTSVTKEFSEVLEARGWNCPNPRFLSCVGADLTSVLEPETAPGAVPLKVADLSKNLRHYRLSCNGVTEHAAEASIRKRAPSTTEP